MLLPQKVIADSTARASKVRVLAGGHSLVLLGVSERLKGKELFEFIALGALQIWHPAPPKDLTLFWTSLAAAAQHKAGNRHRSAGKGRISPSCCDR